MQKLEPIYTNECSVTPKKTIIIKSNEIEVCVCKDNIVFMQARQNSCGMQCTLFLMGGYSIEITEDNYNYIKKLL